MTDDGPARSLAGRPLAAWAQVVDAAGGRDRSHAEIVALLHGARGLPRQLAEEIATLYRALRSDRQGQDGDGPLTVRLERDVAGSAAIVFAAWTDAAAWNAWFTRGATVDARPGGRYANADGDGGTFEAVVPPAHVRFTWENARHCPGTVVDARIVETAPGRTRIELTHEGLATVADRDEMTGGWSWALDSLRAFVESGRGIASADWTPSG